MEKYIYGLTTDGGLQCSYLVVSEHNTKGPMIAIAIVTPSIMAKVTYVHVPNPIYHSAYVYSLWVLNTIKSNVHVVSVVLFL